MDLIHTKYKITVCTFGEGGRKALDQLSMLVDQLAPLVDQLVHSWLDLPFGVAILNNYRCIYIGTTGVYIE